MSEIRLSFRLTGDDADIWQAARNRYGESDIDILRRMLRDVSRRLKDHQTDYEIAKDDLRLSVGISGDLQTQGVLLLKIAEKMGIKA